jgi:hypothetical protein
MNNDGIGHVSRIGTGKVAYGWELHDIKIDTHLLYSCIIK